MKGKIANGVVVGEYSLDFRQYPKYPYTPEQLTKLQNLLLAQQKVRACVHASADAFSRRTNPPSN